MNGIKLKSKLNLCFVYCFAVMGLPVESENEIT